MTSCTCRPAAIDALGPTLVPSDCRPPAQARLDGTGRRRRATRGGVQGVRARPRSIVQPARSPGEFTKVEDAVAEGRTGAKNCGSRWPVGKPSRPLWPAGHRAAGAGIRCKVPRPTSCSRKIETAADSTTTPGALATAEPKMPTFLRRFPDDHRTPQVQELGRAGRKNRPPSNWRNKSRKLEDAKVPARPSNGPTATPWR